MAKNAVFKVKGLPVFYAPYIYYPIRKDGRSTGFLFPHFGYSSYRGFNTGTGFFWAMGRSFDQTLYADYYSKVGHGFGHELRYVQASPSRGTFRTYLFQFKATPPVVDPGTGEATEGVPGTTDYDIDWNALQMLPGKVRATVNVRKYSDLFFQQRFQDDFNLAANRTERWSAALEKDLRLAVLSASMDTTSTYFGTDYRRVNGRAARRLPAPLPAAGRLGHRFRPGGDRRAHPAWRRGTGRHLGTLRPRPHRLPAVQAQLPGGQPLRRLPLHPLRRELRGGRGRAERDRRPGPRPVFLRGAARGAGADVLPRLRHPRLRLLRALQGHDPGSRVSATYRTRVEDFNSIPKFDGDDYVLGTNQIAYSLVQRFYSKRRGPTGKAQPYEFFLWRLMQTYYVQIADGQNNFDPNYSSSAFGPGFRPEHFSPLMSRMRLKPTPGFSLDFNVEYDVNFKQVRRTGLSGNINAPRLLLNAGWSRFVRLAEDPAARTVGAHTLRGSTTIDLVPRRLSLEGSADYDLRNDLLWQMRGQLRYSVQCCGFVVEHIRYNWNGRDEVQWRFNLELANVGSIGNFMGAGASGSQGLGGYR